MVFTMQSNDATAQRQTYYDPLTDNFTPFILIMMMWMAIFTKNRKDYEKT